MKHCYDLTIDEFNRIMKIAEDAERPRYEREVEMLLLTNPNLTEDEIYDMPLEVVDDAITNLIKVSTGPIHEVAIVGDKEFYLKGNKDDFKLSYRQFKSFEKSIMTKDVDYLSRYMSTIYVSDDTTEDERYELFKQMRMEYVVQFAMILEKSVMKK